MGVCFRADGLGYEDGYDCGYMTLFIYKTQIAFAVSLVAGFMYQNWALGTFDTPDPHDDEDARILTIFPCDTKRVPIPDSCHIWPSQLARMCAEAIDGAVAGTDGNGDPTVTFSLSALDEFLRRELGDATMECLLYAPDTEGELTPQECADLLADLDSHLEGKEPPNVRGHNYGETEMVSDEAGRPIPRMREYPMHDQFRRMLRHCAENGVPLVWD